MLKVKVLRALSGNRRFGFDRWAFSRSPFYVRFSVYTPRHEIVVRAGRDSCERTSVAEAGAAKGRCS
jgi:hypothetical protein